MMLHQAMQSRCHIMSRSDKNVLKAALSSRQLGTGAELLEERMGAEPGLCLPGADGAAGSSAPCFVLVL